MNSPSIINESQVANSSIAMVRSIRKIYSATGVGGTGMRKISKTSRDLDFCDKGRGLYPSVPMCEQWFWYTFAALYSHSLKFLKQNLYWKDEGAHKTNRVEEGADRRKNDKFSWRFVSGYDFKQECIRVCIPM